MYHGFIYSYNVFNILVADGQQNVEKKGYNVVLLYNYIVQIIYIYKYIHTVMQNFHLHVGKSHKCGPKGHHKAECKASMHIN